MPHHFDAAYWNGRFETEFYKREGDRFEDFESAYRFGHSLRGEFDDFNLHEARAEALWNREKGESKLTWERAKDAIKAAWHHAESYISPTKFEQALQQGKENLRAVYHKLEDKVKDHPGEYVLGAAATGYLARHLPLRSMFLTSVGLLTAAAPPALLFLGLWKAADHLLGKQALGNSRKAAGPSEQGIIVTDVV